MGGQRWWLAAVFGRSDGSLRTDEELLGCAHLCGVGHDTRPLTVLDCARSCLPARAHSERPERRFVFAITNQDGHPSVGHPRNAWGMPQKCRLMATARLVSLDTIFSSCFSPWFSGQIGHSTVVAVCDRWLWMAGTHGIPPLGRVRSSQDGGASYWCRLCLVRLVVCVLERRSACYWNAPRDSRTRAHTTPHTHNHHKNLRNRPTGPS